MMARRRIDPEAGRHALETWLAGEDQGAAAPDRGTLATAVRYTLEVLAETAPGNSVEVRVPPFGVTQCVEGPRHTRGTPPNVVEADPLTWLRLATGRLGWDEAKEGGTVHASGTRAELGAVLPLWTL